MDHVQTSPDEFDDSQAAQWETAHVDDTPDTPPSSTSPTNEHNAEAAPRPAAPTQKRRRVTRACDECRRKKIKCDGKQPCTHCTVYSYECTYDQPSNRRRNAAPQYIEALENRLKRAEALLHILLPNVDLNDPELESRLQHGLVSSSGPPSSFVGNFPSLAPQAEKPLNPADGGIDAQLESMVKATGQLVLDDQGHWDYRGHSSGFSFVRRMREQFGDLIGPEGKGGTPFSKPRIVPQTFESPKSSADSPMDPTSPHTDLPSKEAAKLLCDLAINDASALLRIVHMPSFSKSLDRIYEVSPENYGNDENTFLPLLYAVLAVGSLHAKDDAIDRKGYKSAIDEGFKYFKASRHLIDIADCRDLQSLQAVIFMIMFLQSSAKLSTCYSYIGVANRSALRMGLHRSIRDNFSPIELEMRKRTFWVIRKMDIYVGALLGLPHTMSEHDIDQDYPAEVDDEYITETEILPMPSGQISLMTATNAHTRLVHLLEKIVRYIYPLKGAKSNAQGTAYNSYSISYAKIRELEKGLQDWLEKLPMGLKPGGEAPPIIVRVQQLLRMAYAHAQMMLYRPFLHYVSQNVKSTIVDKRAYACAAACVSVSRNIIHITTEMKKRGLLIGAYWFTMYTTFFAILSLVYFVLENPDTAASQDVLRDVNEGKETLQQLAKRSMAADRCTITLAPLFEQLPERVRRGRQSSITKKRRQTPSPNQLLNQHMQAASEPNSHSADIPQTRGRSTIPDKYPTVRHATFPHEPPHPQFPRTALHDFYDTAPSLTPSSASASTFPVGTPQPASSFPVSPNFFHQNPPLPDLSSVMFPSADPFAYPNQAMATFENAGYGDAKDDLFYGGFGPQHTINPQQQGGSTAPNLLMNPSSALASPAGLDNLSNDMDVQPFGPMPMYLTHGGPPPPLQQSDQQELGLPAPMQAQRMGGQNAGAVNLDELFGGEGWVGAFSDYQGGLGGGGGEGWSIGDDAQET